MHMIRGGGLRDKEEEEEEKEDKEESRLTCPPSLASTVAVSPFNLMILAVNLIV
jgi:hypothetical protein